jgi:hypothetical protein
MVKLRLPIVGLQRVLLNLHKRIHAYDPDEPRDDHGRWGSGNEEQSGGIKLYRAGEVSDSANRGVGVFLTTDKTVAQQYSDNHSGAPVKEYSLADGLKVKDAESRWSLVREVAPKWDRNKVYDRYIAEQRRNGYQLVDGQTAEQRLTQAAEKQIKVALSKQGYHAVKYTGGGTDQGGEYQVFDFKHVQAL